MRYILAFMLLFSFNVFAMPQEDKVAHTLVTYTLITTSYQLCKNHAKELTQDECLVMSYGGSIIAGLIKEFVIDEKADPFDMLANGVGVGLSIPILKWEF